MGLDKLKHITQHMVGAYWKLNYKITSHYHKSRDFQDNSANHEFFWLTEDLSFRW